MHNNSLLISPISGDNLVRLLRVQVNQKIYTVFHKSRALNVSKQKWN